jgi:hypothetical protein
MSKEVNEMKRNRFVHGFLFVAFTLTLSVTLKSAWAGSQFFDPINTCTTLTCQSSTFRGTYENINGLQQPFIAQLFAQPNECVRIEVTSQQTDLEMVLVSPDGTFWRDDNGGEGQEPLIKAVTAGEPDGWYTLQISHFAANGPSGGSDFTFRYGRYNPDNPNCSGATTPAVVEPFEEESQKLESSFDATE